MTEAITNELMFEVLKKLQDGQTTMMRELREVKANGATMLGIIGELVKSQANDQWHFAELEVRIERIERRLDIIDHAP